MATHFSVLPSDILELLSSSLQASNQPLRFLRLPHPRTGLPALFLSTGWLPSSSESRGGILEVQSTIPVDERSWILDEQIIADGKLLTMSPIDPAFLLLPILKRIQTVNSNTEIPQFRTSDDIFEAVASKFESDEESPNAASDVLRKDVLYFCSLECSKKALAHLCEVKEISTDIVVYKYSSEKSVKYLRAKVANLESSAAFDASRTLTRNLAKDGLMDDGQESLLKAGRTRACCDLIAQYLSTEMRDALIGSYDFAALQKYVDFKKEEAMARAAEPPVKSKSKPGGKETAAASKKRKPTKGSHGVETLKKANTGGMSKISTFFNKKA